MHPDKHFVMRLTHARNVKHFNCTLGNTILQETDSYPYLGVCITKDLTWNKHIQQITTSANHTLAFIRRYLKSCPMHNGSGVELQTLNYENPGSNPVLQC